MTITIFEFIFSLRIVKEIGTMIFATMLSSVDIIEALAALGIFKKRLLIFNRLSTRGVRTVVIQVSISDLNLVIQICVDLSITSHDDFKVLIEV